MREAAAAAPVGVREADGRGSVTVELHIGQAVPWRAAPTGIAQISDLRRRNVELCYLAVGHRRARIRRAIVPASRVASLLRREPLLFACHNLYGRGVIPRRRTYEIPPPPPLKRRGRDEGVFVRTNTPTPKDLLCGMRTCRKTTLNRLYRPSLCEALEPRQLMSATVWQSSGASDENYAPIWPPERSEVRDIIVDLPDSTTLTDSMLSLGLANGDGSGANDGSANTDISSTVLGTPVLESGEGYKWKVPIVASTTYSDGTGSLKNGIYHLTVTDGSDVTAPDSGGCRAT